MGQKRRQFLIVTGALLAARLVHAQQTTRTRKIGYLAINDPNHPAAQQFRAGMTSALAQLGYKEGENLTVEWRYADGRPERLRALAEELVRANVELIMSPLNATTFAAQRATKTIPIVMLTSGHPVENGFIASHARPAGNITGLDVWPTPELAEKSYQILKHAVPSAKVAASLSNTKDPSSRLYAETATRVKTSLGLSVQTVDMQRTEDFAGALSKIVALKPDVLFVSGGEVISPRYKEIIEFTIKRRLVSLSSAPTYAAAGGLLGYGIAVPTIWERSASYVDRILRGAKPADLPVEQPTKYELVLNMKTAKAMDVKLSPSFMAQVDRTIE